MAGAKLSARQKMINLMYLIFIAMLALNTSKEVLSAFGLMNERLTESNEAATTRNTAFMDGLTAKALEQPAKYNPLKEKADAIGGVAVKGALTAVADFYNHRIILQQDNKTTTFGIEGHGDGELYYPTDVEIKNDLIYVADAYNNRVQSFNLNGDFVKVIGWNENIKVATGVKVTDTNIIIADFDGSRILIYNLEDELKQILSDQFNQPTDIELIGNTMFIANYKGEFISVFELK